MRTAQSAQVPRTTGRSGSAGASTATSAIWQAPSARDPLQPVSPGIRENCGGNAEHEGEGDEPRVAAQNDLESLDDVRDPRRAVEPEVATTEPVSGRGTPRRPATAAAASTPTAACRARRARPRAGWTARGRSAIGPIEASSGPAANSSPARASRQQTASQASGEHAVRDGGGLGHVPEREQRDEERDREPEARRAQHRERGGEREEEHEPGRPEREQGGRDGDGQRCERSRREAALEWDGGRGRRCGLGLSAARAVSAPGAERREPREGRRRDARPTGAAPGRPRAREAPRRRSEPGGRAGRRRAASRRPRSPPPPGAAARPRRGAAPPAPPRASRRRPRRRCAAVASPPASRSGAMYASVPGTSPTAVSVSASSNWARPKSSRRTETLRRLLDEHVRRLHVAVDDPEAVRVREAIEDLRCRLDGLAVAELARSGAARGACGRGRTRRRCRRGRCRRRSRRRERSARGAAARPLPSRAPRARRASPRAGRS